MTSPIRKREIQLMVQQQIVEAIREDLDGGESLFKEVWEQYHSEGENKTARTEMKRIIKILMELE